MPTQTIDQIFEHGSIRKYETDPIPLSMIEVIVSAGQRASTSSNLQSYSVVAVTDVRKRERLSALCGDQEHIRQAPVFLAWCADLSRLNRACELRGYQQVTNFVENFLVAAVDAAIAMQNATLAAESLGLGMCYIGSIRNDPDAVIELLELPKLVFPISGMTIGWPAVTPRLKPRLPQKTILHWESYSQDGEDEALRAYDQVMIRAGIYKGRQVPVPGKDGEEEDYSWMEHSSRRVSQPVRTALKKILAQQGFDLE